jgi:amidohydrolase
METLKNKIRNEVNSLEAELIELRRHLHMIPETSGQEVETSKFIAQYLRKLGLQVQEGVGGNGVVACLEGVSTTINKANKDVLTLGLRADMDALPILEQNDVCYKSQNDGVMHACGHDAHMAILLLTAKILVNFKKELSGNVKFIFQPSEENPPGGAIGMINDGVMDNPPVDGVLGLHVNPYVSAGVIGYRVGEIMANADNFELIIKGKGGHGAAPHQTVDAIVLAAMVIQGIQVIPSRFVDPLEPVVITIGKISGGYKTNIIADEVVLKGTIRTLSPILRKEVPGKLQELVAGMVKGYGGDYSFKYNPGYPATVNDKVMTEKLKCWASEILGAQMVEPLQRPSMGGEDFAYFLQRVPGTFFHLGVAPKGDIFPWHHPSFDLDESALKNGVQVMVYSAINYLHK